MKLFIHIGQHKTGSSYIQRLIAEHAEELQENDIFYPMSPNFRNATLNGEIRSGNKLWYAKRGVFDYYSSHFRKKDLKNPALLFSSELFSDLIDDFGVDEFVDRTIDFHKIANFNVLLYIRNPISHFISEYNQAIKASGLDMSVDDYAHIYDTPKKIENIVKFFRKRKEVNLRVLNYSYHQNHLSDGFLDWIGMKGKINIIENRKLENPSLSQDDIDLMRAINKILGANQIGKLIAQKIELREKYHPIFVTKETQKFIWKKIKIFLIQ